MMTSQAAILNFIGWLYIILVSGSGILFGGPDGRLLPNNPKKCTTENVTLTCTVNDGSYTSADIKFRTNGDVLIPENQTKIVDSSTKSLTLMDLTMNDYDKNIICFVNNYTQANDIVDTQILKVYEYPISVVNFSCVRFGWNNRMTCTWNLGQTYRKLPERAVHWRIPSYSGSWNPCPLLTANETQCDWNDTGSLSDRDIQVEINITSSCGISVIDIFDVSTADIVKPDPMTELGGEIVTSTSLMVKWSYTKSREQTKQYRIELSSNWNDSVEPFYVNQTDANHVHTSYHHLFSGLIPNTEYTFAASIKPIPVGIWSDVTITKVMTCKDIPFASPEVTEGGYMWDPSQCENRGRRTVWIYFKSIPKQYENGYMKEVTGTSRTTFYHNSVSATTIGVPAHYTQLSVELDCNKDYSFDIGVENEVNHSTKVSSFNIPKVKKDLRIPDVIVESSSNRTVYLNWSLETGTKPTGFTVFFCKRDRGNCKNDAEIHWKKVPGDINTFTLQDISSPEEFLYGVSMETQDGSTGLSWESCIYSFHAKPQQQPGTPTVSVASKDNTLSVCWNRIECVSGSPYFKFYKVIYCEWDTGNNCTNNQKEITVPATQTSLMIEGLKEDVQYGVLIQAVTADVQLGPASDPAFGTPRNRSLKHDAVIGIVIGSLFGCMLIAVGIVTICRCINRKRKEMLRPTDIDDIIAKTASMFVSQNFTGGDSSSDPYDSINQVATIPNGQPPVSPRTSRQNSGDSGLPEDPLTPKPADDTMQFPETGDKTPLNPDKIKVIPCQVPPADYSRVNTESDNIPRIKSNPDINADDKGNSQPKPYIPMPFNLTIGFSPKQASPIVIFRADQPQNLKETGTETNISNLEDEQRNMEGTKNKGNVRMTEKIKAEGTSSYAKATLVQKNVSNGYVPHSVPITVAAYVQHSSNYDTQAIDSSTNNYVSHEEAQDADSYQRATVSENTKNIHAHEAVNPANDTKYLASSPQSHAPVSATTSISLEESQRASTEVINPRTVTDNQVDTITQANTDDYISHDTALHASTTNHSSDEIPVTGSSYQPHNTASNTINYVSDEINQPGNQNTQPSVFGAYLPHSNMTNNIQNNYTPYIAASDIRNSDFHVGAQSTDTMRNPSSDIKDSTKDSEAAGSYLPHNSVVKDNLDLGTNYIPNSTAEFITVEPHSELMLPLSASESPALREVKTTVSTSSYLPHQDMVVASGDDYLPRGEITNIGSNLTQTNNAMPVAKSVKHNSSGDYLPHSQNEQSPVTAEVGNTSLVYSNGYVPFSDMTEANANGYLPHDATREANTAKYLTYNDMIATNACNDLTQSDTINESAEDYLPHINTTAPNTGGPIAENDDHTEEDSSLPHKSEMNVNTNSSMVYNTSAEDENSGETFPTSVEGDVNDYVSYRKLFAQNV